ncbi:TIM barrel protein [Prosthecomicrobium sp. N25]|uniref:TIM barrel protein n=1 Tax=Prosthecomicrobium sp. N25 TaxID=3129254 RepID=UPI00307860CD
MRLGISPIGWTNNAIIAMGDHVPFEACIAEAAAAGYEGIELGRKFPENPMVLRARLAERGLVPVTGWYSGELARRGVEEEWAAARTFVDHLLALGCGVLVYGECGHGPAAGSAAPLGQALPHEVGQDYADRVTAFAERLAATGLTLAYHPHMMQAVDTNDRIHRLMESTGLAVGLLLDTGHIAMSGGDYREIVEAWWPRVVHLHLKDVDRRVLGRLDPALHSFDDAVWMGLFTVPGEGDIDFAPLAQAIAQHGFDGWCVVEAERDPTTISPGLLARRAYDHLTQLLAEAGVPSARAVRGVAR